MAPSASVLIRPSWCVPASGSFRDLCALCWMLHVRDQLSRSCRQYQKAREDAAGKKVLALPKRKKKEQALLAKLSLDRFYCLEQNLLLDLFCLPSAVKRKPILFNTRLGPRRGVGLVRG